MYRAGIADVANAKLTFLHQLYCVTPWLRKGRRDLAHIITRSNPPIAPAGRLSYLDGGADGTRTRDLLRDREAL